MEYSQFDRRPAYASSDRRSGGERRSEVRREIDRAARMREVAAFAVAVCGGLVLLYAFFVAIGTVNIGDAVTATVAVVALAVIWLLAFWRRLRTGAALVQRPDRERRGF